MKNKKPKPELLAEETVADVKKPLGKAYQPKSNRKLRFRPLFEDLGKNLQRAGLKVNFKAYVRSALLVSFLITLPVATVATFLLLFIFHVPLAAVVLFDIGFALFTWAFSVIGFYMYPIYRADKHRRELDDELPFATGYMAILASAEVVPEKIFYSLSTLSPPLAASKEAKDIIAHVNLFGFDVISSLGKVSSRTPSEKLRETVEGMISVIHTGGNLGAFLREKFKMHMKLKRIALKKYSDSLAIMAEGYVALLLTGPLLIVIMLAVMSVLGGGSLGMFSPDFLLNLLAYIGIPVCSIIFLIILDSMSPKW